MSVSQPISRPKPNSSLITRHGKLHYGLNRIRRWIMPNWRGFSHNRQPLVWLLGLIIGVAVAVLAICFRELIGLVQLPWLGERSESFLTEARAAPWYVILITPIIGGLIVGLIVQFLLKLRRTGGVADAMEARHMTGRRLSLREGLLSALVSGISLGVGGSAGREGPMIHLGACFSAWLTSRFQLPDSAARSLLAAGAASAVAASFNAPIAGVLFAHEVILGHYAMRAFVPIVISSVSGAVLSRMWFGEETIFRLPDYIIQSYWEFPAFFVLGIVCALVAISFQFSLVGMDLLARKFTMPLWFRPVIGGAVIGGIGLYYPEIFGVGYETTDNALWGRLSLQLMLFLIVLKMFATAVTLASRFGGGVFSPALYLGALTGGAYGLIVTGLVPDFSSDHGLYAILGMGAVSATVIGAPISTAVIVFELTSGYELSIALLLTVAVSHGVNHAIHGRSFFQWQLEMRGLYVRDGTHRATAKNIKVMDFMTVIAPEDEEKFDASRGTPSLKTSDSLETALQLFDAGGHRRLPVVDEIDGEMIIAWAEQIRAIEYYNHRLIATHQEEHS